MSDLPSGTTVFLFSDIEGSTRHWQDDGEGMRSSLAMHDRLLGDAIAQGNGQVLKHTGDGMVAVFKSAADAVHVAVDVQRAITTADWAGPPIAVRVAIHAGDAQQRDGDYFGPTLNRAARLMSAAHGGQILVSAAAAALAAPELAEGIRLDELGEFSLRDLDRREQISQVSADGLEQHFLRLRAAGGELHGFPVTRTPLIGREKLLANVESRLADAPLVTLTGVGGCGKTRVAIEVGCRFGEKQPDGAVFVDLAPLADPTLIASTIAQLIGAGDEMGGVADERVQDFLVARLRDRRMLVVLDNCEHLIDGCADLADRLLAECASVRILATSREGLALDGEQVVAVPSLELPGDDRPAADSEAVLLLVDRAQAQRSGTSAADLLGMHETAVVEICRRLDGIPLALELAAAQIAHFSPEEVAERLGDRFRLLSGGRRRVQRQATLQAAVDWSYDLLDESERKLLARLGVFAGDFSLAAAEGICAGGEITTADVVRLVSALVSKSLVIANPVGPVTRYRLLETVRIYSEERLVDFGESEAVRDLHLDWYVQELESLDRDRLSCLLNRTVDDLTGIHGERDNVRAALAWAKEQGRIDLVARIAVASDVLWFAVGNQDEGLSWLNMALADEGLDDVLRTRCLTMSGWVSMQRGDFAAMPGIGVAAVDTARAAGLIDGAKPEAIGALTLAAFSYAFGDQKAGRKVLAPAREIAERLGSERALASVDWMEAELWLTEGDYDRACGLSDRARERMSKLAPSFWEPVTFVEHTLSLYLSGRIEEARAADLRADDARVAEAERLVGYPSVLASPLFLASSSGTKAALTELLVKFERVQRSGAPLMAPYVVTLMAIVLATAGEDEDALTVLSVARRDRDLPWRSPGHFALYQHYRRLLRDRLDDERIQACRERAAGMSLADAVDVVRSSRAIVAGG